MPLKAQIARLKKESPDSAERMEMVRVQIFLDRPTSAGKDRRARRRVHAKGGGSLLPRQRFAAGKPSRCFEHLRAISPIHYYQRGLEMDRPAGLGARRAGDLKAMLYADLWELVAERFHCDLDFLRELNPKVSKGEWPSAQSSACRM